MYNKKVLIDAVRNLSKTKNSTNTNNGLDNNFKRGGSNKRPSLPKSKSPRSYSRSFEATNRLFAQHPLFKKPKSRKNKIFDPNSQYYDDGGPIYNNLPFTYLDALRNFTSPNISNDYTIEIDPETGEEVPVYRTGYNALNDTITYNPYDEIENVNNPWWNEHEKFHHLQNLAGGLSTSGVVGQRPNPYVASDESIGAYYDRRNSDVNRTIDRMIAQDPNLQFIPREKLAKGAGPGFIGAEDLQYADPTTVEGEARQYEGYIRDGNPSIFNTLKEKRIGGLVQYDQGGDPCPSGYIRDENGDCVWHDPNQENLSINTSPVHPVEYLKSQLTMGDPFYNTHEVYPSDEGDIRWQPKANIEANLRNTNLKKFIQRDPDEGPGVESGYLHNNIWTSPTLGLEQDTIEPGYAPNQLRYERDGQHPNVYFIKNPVEGSTQAPSGSYTRGWGPYQNKKLSGAEYNKAQNEVGQNLLKQGYKGENMWGAGDEEQLYQLYGTEGLTLKGATKITPETLKYLESIKDSEEGKRYLAKMAGISEDDPDYANMLMHYNTTPIDVYAKSSRPGYEDIPKAKLEQDNNNQTTFLTNTEGPVNYKRGGLTQYAPGGDWPPLKKGAVYVNPLYMGNFVGGNNSFDTLTGENAAYDIYNPYSASSFNVGVQLPLSKNRRIDSEKTKGWMMDAYVGMPYSQMIGEDAKFLPSAGVKFDYENSPQNDPTYGFRKFRPFVNLGAEYSPTDGFGVGAFGGGRTPFGKTVKPGYGAGHMDAYAGFQGGLNLGKGNAQLSPIIGGRIKGEYEPNRKSFLNKVLGDDVSIFGEAGATANFFKGKMTQRETDDMEVVATGNNSVYGGPDFGTAEREIQSQPDTVGVGFDFYGNVGLKKKFSDFKSTKKNTADKRIQEIEDNEKRAFQESEVEKEEPKKEKPKKECPEGEMRYCEDCPCEPIERVSHPRWLQYGGGIDLNLTDEDIQRYVDGGYIIEDISVPSLNQYDEGGMIEASIDENGTPKCPEGYIYNPENGYCEKPGDTCPKGYEKDPETGKCRVKLKACSSSKSTEPKYKYSDCIPERTIPEYEGPQLELEKPVLPDYEFPTGKYYPKKKKYLQWYLNQRYDTQPLVRVRQKFVSKKEDPFIRFLTGYDKAKGSPELYKKHKEWNERLIKEGSDAYNNTGDVEVPSFRGIPIASWEDLRNRKAYKKEFKDYVKNELPALRARNEQAKAAYEQQLRELVLLKQQEEEKRKKSGIDFTTIRQRKTGGLVQYAPGGWPPKGLRKSRKPTIPNEPRTNKITITNPKDRATNLSAAQTIKAVQDRTVNLWNSAEGQRRLQNLINTTPALKANLFFDSKDMVSDLANTRNLNQEAITYTKTLDDIIAEQNKIDSYYDQNLMTDNDYFNTSVSLDNQLKTAEETYAKLLQDSNTQGGAFYDRNENAFVINPKFFTNEELPSVGMHEIIHLPGLKRGTGLTSLDVKLGGLDLKNQLDFDLSNTSNNNIFYKHLNKDGNYLQNAISYYNLNGGFERSPFLAELRENMLQDNIIKHPYQKVNSKMIKDYYKDYLKKENKFPLRIFDIMTNKPKNFGLLSNTMNELPSFAPYVIGAGTAALLGNPFSAESNLEDNQYAEGGEPCPDGYIRSSATGECVLDVSPEQTPAEEWYKNWYTNRVIQDVEGQKLLNEARPKLLKRTEKFPEIDYDTKGLGDSSGMYNPMTGKISLNSSQITSPFIRDEVLFHEKGHYLTSPSMLDPEMDTYKKMKNHPVHKLREYETGLVNQALVPKNKVSKEEGKFYDYISGNYGEEISKRIMELRRLAGFKPDQEITDDDLKNFYQKAKTKGWTDPNSDAFVPALIDFQRFINSPQDLKMLLNKMAKNESRSIDEYAPQQAQYGGTPDYQLGDEINKATMEKLKKLGYTFEKIK